MHARLLDPHEFEDVRAMREVLDRDVPITGRKDECVFSRPTRKIAASRSTGDGVGAAAPRYLGKPRARKGMQLGRASYRDGVVAAAKMNLRDRGTAQITR